AKTKLRPSDKYLSDMELPSVSVCIPARNESENLPGCLASIVDSDYPKLEILVLDDCSQDKTSEIIKGFAHDGVRFVPGDAPKDDWLAKNQAYQVLYEHASGRILIFCGVDVRVGKDAIKKLVVTMLARHKQMISVMPKGVQKTAKARLLQPMRYWWELALPRRLFNRPPVLSTFWAIDKETFKGLGTMKAVKGSVMPETYFAKSTSTHQDGYSFMRSNGGLDLTSTKPYVDQLQTSIRTRYPRLKSRIENVLLMVCLELCMVVLPLVGLAVFGLWPSLLTQFLALAVIVVMMATHWMVVRAWGVANPVMALVLLPASILSEAIITLVSMWRYEFAEVSWKDRNICIPAMRYYKKLPDIEDN
ncbi:glycosyltransferase, partial [Candidatus Saccharibacteria bacterium]|nr:glycosyltransferase [Candidatus Saccharibacteria bacterium]